MLRLRALTADDAEAVQRIYSGRAVADMWFGQMTGDQARTYVRDAVTCTGTGTGTGTQRVCGIEVDADLLGIVRLRIGHGTGHDTGHLSYILREDSWGNGYATAAVRLFLAEDRTGRATPPPDGS
ncbi:GNAT family N-acetyltransferase [Kitasatospora sp. NPDC008050]|uniref:GNAT family N-acetyltransferase n=1 Tax=Kitasatospora sp. NPDC008050 TaxID=3364021 RepID=UPI0036E0069F